MIYNVHQVPAGISASGAFHSASWPQRWFNMKTECSHYPPLSLPSRHSLHHNIIIINQISAYLLFPWYDPSQCLQNTIHPIKYSYESGDIYISERIFENLIFLRHLLSLYYVSPFYFENLFRNENQFQIGQLLGSCERS